MPTGSAREDELQLGTQEFSNPRGIVIAKTENDGDNFCFVVLEEKAVSTGAGCAVQIRNIVRPIPAFRNVLNSTSIESVLSPVDTTKPFWKGRQYSTICVGDIVEFGRENDVRNGSWTNSSTPHRNEDELCEFFNRTSLDESRLLSSGIYNRLAPVARGELKEVWPDNVFEQGQGGRYIRADADVASVLIVRGSITRIFKRSPSMIGKAAVRADMYCGGKHLCNVPVKCSIECVQDQASIPGLLVLGLARNKYSAAHQCPILLCGFYPEPAEDDTVEDETLLNIPAQSLCMMVGLLSQSLCGAVSNTEEMFNYFLAEVAPEISRSMGVDEVQMIDFANSYQIFFDECVTFVRCYNCCVVCFPTKANPDEYSFSLIAGDEQAANYYRVIISTIVESAEKAIAIISTISPTMIDRSEYDLFLQNLCRLTNDGNISDSMPPCSSSCEKLTQAVNAFVFDVWGETRFAEKRSPMTLPALRICYRNKLLQQQIRKISIMRYDKSTMEQLVRVNQSVAANIERFQNQFGYGQWDTDQKANNTLLNRQVEVWQNDLQSMNKKLQQLEHERRQQIEGKFTLPDFATTEEEGQQLRIDNDLMQTGMQVLQNLESTQTARRPALSETMQEVAVRCEKSTPSIQILFGSNERDQLSR
jgi:hypothetical protein